MLLLNDFQKRKKKRRLCISFRCINEIKNRNYCGSCSTKFYRKKYPLKYIYSNLKNNSKRRKKEFTLTFKEFKEFAIKVDLLYKGGRTKTSWHIDRKDETKGYIVDNIQLLKSSENIKKYFEYNKTLKKAKIFTLKKKENKHKNVPF